MNKHSSGIQNQAYEMKVEDTDSSDWDSNSEEDSMDTESEADMEQEGG